MPFGIHLLHDEHQNPVTTPAVRPGVPPIWPPIQSSSASSPTIFQRRFQSMPHMHKFPSSSLDPNTPTSPPSTYLAGSASTMSSPLGSLTSPLPTPRHDSDSVPLPMSPPSSSKPIQGPTRTLLGFFGAGKGKTAEAKVTQPTTTSKSPSQSNLGRSSIAGDSRSNSYADEAVSKETKRIRSLDFAQLMNELDDQIVTSPPASSSQDTTIHLLKALVHAAEQSVLEYESIHGHEVIPASMPLFSPDDKKMAIIEGEDRMKDANGQWLTQPMSGISVMRCLFRYMDRFASIDEPSHEVRIAGINVIHDILHSPMLYSLLKPSDLALIFNILINRPPIRADQSTDLPRRGMALAARLRVLHVLLGNPSSGKGKSAWGDWAGVTTVLIDWIDETKKEIINAEKSRSLEEKLKDSFPDRHPYTTLVSALSLSTTIFSREHSQFTDEDSTYLISVYSSIVWKVVVQHQQEMDRDGIGPVKRKPSVTSMDGTACINFDARLKPHPLVTTFITLITDLLKSSSLPSDSVYSILRLLLYLSGYRSDTEDEVWETIQMMFKRGMGFATMQALTSILRGDGREPEADEKAITNAESEVTLGAVRCIRRMLASSATSALQKMSNQDPFGGMDVMPYEPHLKAAMAASRFSKEAIIGGGLTVWQEVDEEVLLVLSDYMKSLDMLSKAEGLDFVASGWETGDVVVEILDQAKCWIEGFKLRSGKLYLIGRELGTFSESQPPPSTTSNISSTSSTPEVPSIITTFCDVLQALPFILGKESPINLPYVPMSPQMTELLLSLSPQLSELASLAVVDHYQQEGRCAPSYDDWINNIKKLVSAFYVASGPTFSVERPATRRKLARFLFKEVYQFVRDVDDRSLLVEEIILPLLELTASRERDPEIEKWSWEVLEDAAISETVEMDEDQIEADQGYFNRIRKLVNTLATTSQPPILHEISSLGSTTLLTSLVEPESSRSIPLTALAFAKEEHPLLADSNAESQHPSLPSSVPLEAAHQPPSPPTPSIPLTRSARACCALIAIFTGITFTAPDSLIADVTRTRAPASSRSIFIFNDILNLVAPAPAPNTLGSRSESPSRAPKPDAADISHLRAADTGARLLLLQWLMRLRADRKHRIFIQPNVDDDAKLLAMVIGRTEESIAASTSTPNASTQGTSSTPASEGLTRRPSKWGDTRAEERGRDQSRAGAMSSNSTKNSRSRSQSRHAMVRNQAVTVPEHQLWQVPESHPFVVPEDTVPTEGLHTFDPLREHARDPDPSKIPQGEWLPVSQYIRRIFAILSDSTEWELASYVLCHLPSQLSNKHFFCGPRAEAEMRALRSLFCGGLLDSKRKFLKNVVLPGSLKENQVQALAYQTLSVLVSYKKLFTKAETDDMVAAFTSGLISIVTGRPCVQALTISAYELETSVAKHATVILSKLDTAIGFPVLAVHILEFLVAVGHRPRLYANFTDEQYRKVFGISLSYITKHNTPALGPEATLDDAAREAYTLSQHMLGLAYYVIYVWFLVTKLPLRPTLIPTISSRLINLNNISGRLDEQAEVCFDWLSRYTYSNADPRPAKSELNQLVMTGDGEEKVEEKSWIQGNAIITFSALPRAGWAEIKIRRPSGQVALLVKLENVPVLPLGDDKADMTTLPGVLMANRDPAVMALPDAPIPTLPGEPSPDVIDESDGSLSPEQARDAVSKTMLARPDGAVSPSNAEKTFVWSAETPSQRRKDVVVDPAYIALQLSTYPSFSQNPSSGQIRLIPNSGTFQSSIKILDSIPVIDTHKIAVLYVAPNQTTEQQILGNLGGSPNYMRFLFGLGPLVRLKNQRDIFVGGLDTRGDTDGEYAYGWWDDITQVIYHVATMMPNDPSDPNFNNKKRHLGNDHIRIVFNDSGKEYDFETLRTDFQFLNLVISPHTSGASKSHDDPDEHNFFKITLQKCKGMPEFGPIGQFKIVSAESLPTIIRQFSLMCDFMAQIFAHTKESNRMDYSTTWRRRLASINRIRDRLPKVEEPQNDAATRSFTYDFTTTFTSPPATS